MSSTEGVLNHVISRAGIVGEPGSAGMKRWRSVKAGFRLTSVGISERVMELAGGVHHLRMTYRHPLPTCAVLKLCEAD